MPPITKDAENSAGIPSTPVTNSAPTPKTSSEAGARPQPVALEIPVTVNGARAVEGSSKREPFSESTKTVVVFGNGAVVRVASVLSAGQLIFLTNETTKKEVVCQVVKSKNFRTVTGYVELEFTEPAAGFWGMRFPNDRIGSAAPPAPRPTTVAAGGPKSVAPPMPTSPKPVSKPDSVPVASIPAVIPPVPVLPKPEPQAPVMHTKTSPLPPIPQKPEPVPVVPPPSTDLSTEELRQQTARLQAQLNSFQLTVPTATPSVPAAPEAVVTDGTSTSAVDQTVSSHVPIQTAKADDLHASLPATRMTALPGQPIDGDDVKMPSWLGPLQRQPESGPEPALVSAASVSPEPPSAFATAETESLTPLAEDPYRRPQTAVFGGQLLGEDSSSLSQNSTSGSQRGMWIGVAAALLLAVGVGGWYLRQSGNLLADSGSAKPVRQVETTSPSTSVTPNVASNYASSVPTNFTSVPAPVPAPTSTKSVNVPASSATNGLPVAAAGSSNSQPEDSASVESPRKASLGKVRLATPVVKHRGAATQSTEGTLSLLTSQPSAGGDPLATAAALRSNVPAAPAPVGGDVKPAQLLRSVPPIYPAMAKAQHISGDVQIDALIDPAGNVTSMSIISGPALLHQAATAALKQWKYKPAELDGNPTSMHLTVTLRFRLQ